jgi:GntR family transcriptional regulator
MDSKWLLDMNAGPIFLQIASNVRRMLARGDLVPGEKLPSARDLAAELGVNPNTIVHAFAELERVDVIETKRGLGTFVRTDAPVADMRVALLRTAALTFVSEMGALKVTRSEALGALEEVWNARKS